MNTNSTVSSAGVAQAGSRTYGPALFALTSLFFMWGLITSLNDILIPHLKAAFSLSYVQAMLIQFCFFGAYFVVSLPAGYLVERVGYKRGIIIGLAIAGSGCLLMYAAAGAQVYYLFLVALFVLASGITLLQVAANPYVAVLGPASTASSRLTLTQGFNSLGTTIGPFLGSTLILTAATTTLQGASRAAEAESVQGPYVGLAAVLFVLAVAIAVLKLPAIQTKEELAEPSTAPQYVHYESVWSYRHLVLGAVGIFMYVGGEVSIGSFLVNFMNEVAAIDEETAGKYLSLYWGGAMVGRFIGAWAMTRIKPGTALAFNACVVMALLVLAMLVGGKAAMWAVLAIGLFNSIMFPTIFTLAIEGLGKHTGAGSGVLCMAIVGGAIVPVVQGYVADNVNLLYSFVVPAVCYAYIAYYGLKGHNADLQPAGLSAR